MMLKILFPGSAWLLAGILASSNLFSAAVTQSDGSKKSQAGTAPPTAARTLAPHRHSYYSPVDLPPHAREFYLSHWGVDLLSAKAVDSGLMVRFNYRVVDARKAAALNDKQSTPALIDEKAGVKLVVPSLEKVGELRNKAIPEEGKTYWMVFSNKGAFVKPGHRVSVEIGKFRVDGLIVQ